MVESLEVLIKEKNELQKKANELKNKRNKLHQKSKELADERDKLNSMVRELRNEVLEHKTLRDELNKRVKHAKEERTKLNKECAKIKEKIEQLEKERASMGGENLNDLRRQLRSLEDEQMTQPMSPQKEKKVIEIISELHTKIRQQEERLNKDPRLKKAIEEEKIIKQKAEKQHDTVEKLAKRAQDEHETMFDLIRQIENIVKKVNKTQENIVMTKIEADKIHREFIETVDKIHELEREISTLHKKKHKKQKKEEETSVQKEANEIFERFKRGEKLSTEDLMTLQKAGLI